LNRLSNVSLHNLGLGSQPGQLRISNRRADDMNFVSEDGTPIQVDRMDDVLRDLASIDLLKIDVEGFELEVLKGARETLAKTAQVLFEAYEPQYLRFGYTFSDIKALLETEGFFIQQIQADSRSTAPLPSHFRPDRCCNLLATRPDD